MSNRMSIIQVYYERQRAKYDQLIENVSNTFEDSILFALNCETVGGKFSELSVKMQGFAESIYGVSKKIDENNFPVTKDYLRLIGNVAIDDGNDIYRKYYNAINTVSRKVYDDYMMDYKNQIRKVEENIRYFKDYSRFYSDTVEEIESLEYSKNNAVDEFEKADIETKIARLKNRRKEYLDKADASVDNIRTTNDVINEILEKGLKSALFRVI